MMATRHDWDVVVWTTASRFGVAIDWMRAPVSTLFMYYDGAIELDAHEREVIKHVKSK